MGGHGRYGRAHEDAAADSGAWSAAQQFLTLLRLQVASCSCRALEIT